jgi:hypothetical protein
MSNYEKGTLLLKNIFTSSDATQDQIDLKKEALNRLEETFSIINDTNISKYIKYI